MENSETGINQQGIPAALTAEIVKMRRNPECFRLKQVVKCRFCVGRTKTAYHLTAGNPEKEAGTWCSKHGWIFFDSVGFPPTERLTASEIEDRRLDQRRAAEWQQRQKRKET